MATPTDEGPPADPGTVSGLQEDNIAPQDLAELRAACKLSELPTSLSTGFQALDVVFIPPGLPPDKLHALMAPRPFLVSGGTADRPERWTALNHSIAVNQLLGASNRVAMANRPTHPPTEQSNEQIYRFFEWWLGQPSGGTP